MDGFVPSNSLLPVPFLSPKRNFMMPGGYENYPGSPPIKDVLMYPWNWGVGAQKIQLSPSGSISGLEPSAAASRPVDLRESDAEPNFGHQQKYPFDGFGSPSTPRRVLGNIQTPSPQQQSVDGENSENESWSLKRGRPRADAISSLIVEASGSPSSIRCKICQRVFPREKSLQAHLRTHTGERPYVCDYPGCGRAFCQSGQLKTHQRLHTGEKPFKCAVPDCPSRFTHANRHCQAHPGSTLVRVDPNVLYPTIPRDENNIAVLQWLNKHVESRREHSGHRHVKRALDVGARGSSHDQGNPSDNTEPGVKKLKIEDEENVPESDSFQFDFDDKPLDLSDKRKASHEHSNDENQDTALIRPPANDRPKQNEDEKETILGALALMELAKNRVCKVNDRVRV